MNTIKYSIIGLADNFGRADIHSEPKKICSNDPNKNIFRRIMFMTSVPNARYGPFNLKAGIPISKPKIAAPIAPIINANHIG